MTKKEYCLTHAPVATHDYYYSHIHGIEHGLDGDYVYVSQRRQLRLMGPSEWEFHKLKIHADANGFIYINFPDKCYDGTTRKERRYLEDYIQRGAWLPELSLEDWLKEVEV